MKVLHILDHSLPLQSGYSFRSAAILAEQRKLGIDTVHVTSEKQGQVVTEQEAVGDFYYFRTLPTDSWWARLPVLNQIAVVVSLRRRLKALIKQQRPDVLHAHSPCLTALAAFGLGKPVLYELRSSWEDAAVSNGQTTEGSIRYRLSRALETYVLRRASAVVTICDGLRKDAIQRGVDPEKIAIAPNAVDVARFSSRKSPQQDMRAKLGLDGKRVLGFAGSFYAWEGLPLLVEALATLLRQADDVRVLLVGAGPDEANIRAAVQHFALEQQVIFTGQVRNADVEHYYDAMDVLVYPRVSSRLTDMVTPLKPLEAMALAKPFIASDVGGHRELVEHERTGLLFKAGDATALATMALRALSDVELRQRLVIAGREFVGNQRTWTSAVAVYPPIYLRLTAMSQPS